MENENNLRFLHKECSDKLRAEFQKKFDKFALEVGDFVKAEFKENGISEHIWVKIISLTSKGINGILSNEPVYFKKIKLNDLVFVKFNEIEGCIKPENKK